MTAVRRLTSKSRPLRFCRRVLEVDDRRVPLSGVYRIRPADEHTFRIQRAQYGRGAVHMAQPLPQPLLSSPVEQLKERIHL